MVDNIYLSIIGHQVLSDTSIVLAGKYGGYNTVDLQFSTKFQFYRMSTFGRHAPEVRSKTADNAKYDWTRCNSLEAKHRVVKVDYTFNNSHPSHQQHSSLPSLFNPELVHKHIWVMPPIARCRIEIFAQAEQNAFTYNVYCLGV